MKHIVMSVSAVAVLVLGGCSRTKPNAATPPPAVRAQVVHSVSAQVPDTVTATGTLHAKETAVISAQIPARIRAVLVEPGAHVRAGQLLVSLDNAAMQSGLSQAAAGVTAAEKQKQAAQADAALSEATLARYSILKEQKSISPQEFDEVEKHAEATRLRVSSYTAQEEQARAAVSGAQTQLGYAALHAPFAGIVTARMADPGTLAAPGVPLLQVDREGSLQAYITVDESLIGAIRQDMKIAVTVQGANEISGTVSEIVPAADPSSRSFLIKVALPVSSALRAGMYAMAAIPAGERTMILVTQQAVVLRGSLPCVYVLSSDNTAQLRYVTLGGRHGEQVEILSGLAAGEALVNTPGDRDLAGKRIEAWQ